MGRLAILKVTCCLAAGHMSTNKILMSPDMEKVHNRGTLKELYLLVLFVFLRHFQNGIRYESGGWR